MKIFIIMILILVWTGSIPGWLRVTSGDYRRLFWLDFALDVLVIAVAIFTWNLVVVVTTQLIVSLIFTAISNKRFKALFENNGKNQDKNIT